MRLGGQRAGLAAFGGERCGGLLGGGRGVVVGGVGVWSVGFVDGDVEAGLFELFFDVDFAGLFEGEEPGAEPGDLVLAKAVFGNVDGAAGEVWAGDVTLGRGGVAVDHAEAALVLHGTDSGGDEQGRAGEVRGVSLGDVRKEAGGPGTAVAAVFREFRVDLEGRGDGDGDEGFLLDAVFEVGIVEDALEAFGVGHFVLVDEGLVGSAQGCGHGEVDLAEGRVGHRLAVAEAGLGLGAGVAAAGGVFDGRDGACAGASCEFGLRLGIVGLGCGGSVAAMAARVCRLGGLVCSLVSGGFGRVARGFCRGMCGLVRVLRGAGVRGRMGSGAGNEVGPGMCVTAGRRGFSAGRQSKSRQAEDQQKHPIVGHKPGHSRGSWRIVSHFSLVQRCGKFEYRCGYGEVR